MVVAYDEICYPQNYIDRVVCRMDFASFVDEFKKSMPKEIYDVIKRYYPIVEPRDIIDTEFQFGFNDGSIPVINEKKAKQWHFVSRSRKNFCSIDFEKIVFVCTDYEVFDSFQEMVLSITDVSMKMFPNIQGKRIGLRYVNNLPMAGHSNWIDAKFFGAFTAHMDANTTRLMTRLEYTIDEKGIGVILNYGYINPDYPLSIKKEDFVIDIDSYSKSLIYREDLPQLLGDMHFEAQKCFENIITDELRTHMCRR